MKKTALFLIISLFATNISLFAQKKVKQSGFVSTAGFTMGFFSNFEDLNATIKTYYPEYKEFNPIMQTGFTLGFGYYWNNRFSILTESFASSAPSVSVHEDQYAELRSYGSKIEISYVFYRVKNFDFEFSVGIGGQYNSFLHTIKNEREEYKPNLALNSMNTIVPIGLTWWIYKDGIAGIGERAVGINLDYNFIAHKGITAVTGFTEKAHYPNISSNNLWLSIVLKM
ncbi:MAG: hypothetical protein IKV46_07440 [Bacteroidales bacterium]|jgi:hypothetical protein|nr:hypothetical protein [Bacteroidales bacterium]